METTNARVLVVEDDPNILNLLEAYLSASGFDVVTADRGDDGERLARAGGFDLLLLDVMLPEKTGVEIATAVRAGQDRTPILFLTARGAEVDILEGFAAGADDYVVKPFSARELIARVKAILARAKASASAAPAQAAPGRLSVDEQALTCRVDGALVELTAHEFRILAHLSKAPGRVFDRDQLTTVLYPNGEAIGPKAIDVHIHNLRKKLGADVGAAISTVRGFGYRFDPIEEAQAHG